MRKVIQITVAGLLACASIVIAGDIEAHYFTVNTGTNDTGTVTLSGIRGYVEDVRFEIPAASTTGTVTLAWQPELSGFAKETIATKTDMDADTTVRPRVDGTDTSGAALTSDPPWRYLIAGDVTFTVASASATNKTWKCVLHTKK